MGVPDGIPNERPLEQHISGSDDNGMKKAKGKDQGSKASVAERLEASGRMVLNAMTGTSTMLDGAPGQKETAGPSTSSRLPMMLGEASASQHRARVGEPLRLNQHRQSSSEAFESFVNEQPRLGPLSSSKQTWQNSTAEVPPTSFAEQEATDGAAVVQLLSLPDDSAHALPIENGDGLSPNEAARLREALFGAGNAGSPRPRWGDMLSLVPDFISHPSAASSADMLLQLGTADPAVAEAIWLQRWSDVLSSYTEEVWGDLGPLVAEAKRDVDWQRLGKQPAGSECCETKALRRLRLILAHVRGRI